MNLAIAESAVLAEILPQIAVSPQLLLQSAVSGLLIGGMYGLAALGLALAFGVLKVLNVAHGELIMLGGYASLFIATGIGLDPLAALPIVFAILFAFGLGLHAIVFRQVVQFDIEHRIKNSLLIAFGLALILQALAVRFFTADERATVTDYSADAITLGSIRIPLVRLAGLVIAVLAVVVLEWVLNRTRFGRAIRATSENWTLASLTGIDIRRVYLVSFGIAAGLAGITGTLVSLGFSVSPSIGLAWTLKALIVVVLAGLGSMRGTILAGMLLGLTEAIAAVYVGGQYREVVALVVFLLVLGFRPQGLFGGNRG